MARLAAVAVLAFVVAACYQAIAFVSGPASRGQDAALIAGAAAIASAPQVAGAFVYDGEEYFDIWFGIPPLAWAFTGFVIVGYGAVLKNACQKYNVLMPKLPPKVGGFVGKEVEDKMDAYKV